ncbi:hypothetical protein GCM10017687_30280 [Streptomyces echinatus]
MAEQLTYRHLWCPAQLREVTGGGFVQVEVAVVGQEHDEGGGVGLRERAERDRRPGGDGAAGRDVGGTGVHGDDVRAGVEDQLGAGHPVVPGEGVETVLEFLA